MRSMYTINNSKQITIIEIQNILNANSKLVLSEKVKNDISVCREYLDNRMTSQKTPIYGINTGFGSLCNVVIPDNELEQLQTN